MFNIEKKKKNHQDIVVLNYKKNKDDNIHKNEAKQKSDTQTNEYWKICGLSKSLKYVIHCIIIG